jgi:ubiquinone/menaquinone biosynthesis C-methylase UbiE
MPDIRYQFDPKTRFSSRVENYVKYRPDYPLEIISFLKEQDILKENYIVADIGSGTGKLTELFLMNGNLVYGVEPNDNMRRAAEYLLKKYSNFRSIKGSAEETNLNSNMIDLITAGQAFHWFKVKETIQEFKRILKSNGYVLLIWNNRKKSGHNFSVQYENFILKYGTDYKEVRKNENNIDDFFEYKLKTFSNYQNLNFEGLKGRLLSVSYIPQEGPHFIKMLDELKELFDLYQKDGFVRIEYDTQVYYGKL